MVQCAEHFGLVASPEATEAAAKLAQSFRDLTDCVTGVYKAVGAALGPTIKGITDAITNNMVTVRKWIAAHGEIIRTVFRWGAALGVGGTALFAFGKVFTVAGNAVGKFRDLILWSARSMQTVSNVGSTLLMPFCAVASTLGGALSTGLSLAWKGFSALGSVIGGVFSVASGVLGTAFGLIGDALHGLLSTVIHVVPAVITSLMSLGPVFLIAAPFVALIAGISLVGRSAEAVQKGATAAAASLAKAGAAARDAFGAVKDAAGNATRSAATAIGGYWDSVRSFASNAAAQVSRVMTSLWGDIKIGFRNVVDDVNACMGPIKEAITRGDIAGAWGLALAALKVEWLRFRNWFLNIWEESMLPKINEALPKIIARFGDIFADLKIGWAGMWDNVLKGLHAFLVEVDKAIISVKTTLDVLKTALVNLPGAYSDEREEGERKAMKHAGFSENDKATYQNVLGGWMSATEADAKKGKKTFVQGMNSGETVGEYVSAKGKKPLTRRPERESIATSPRIWRGKSGRARRNRSRPMKRLPGRKRKPLLPRPPRRRMTFSIPRSLKKRPNRTRRRPVPSRYRSKFPI